MSMVTVQRLATDTVMAVEAGQNLTDVLQRIMSMHPDLSAQERGALQDIAYGCQRYLGSLKFFLRQLVAKQLPAPEIEALLLVALYQLNYSKNATHAVVNEAVEVASVLAKGNFKGLVNGVLRNFLREQKALTAKMQRNDLAKHNHPNWWVSYMKTHYPKHWHNILLANQSHPPMTLRVNKHHADAAQYQTLLAEAGIESKILGDHGLKLTKPVRVDELPHFFEGWVSVQDFGAQQAAILLNPQHGERVLDACAAPGGKTGHILEWAECDLTAIDIDERRLARVAQNVTRLGFEAKLVCADAQDLGAWYAGKPFDAILADVPCTASGVVRRHPDIKWLRQAKDAHKVAKQQVNLLDQLWSVLKPDGRMLMATCSLFVEENEQQIDAFLARHSDARLRKQHVFLPNDRHDGFYYALLQKY